MKDWRYFVNKSLTVTAYWLELYSVQPRDWNMKIFGMNMNHWIVLLWMVGNKSWLTIESNLWRKLILQRGQKGKKRGNLSFTFCTIFLAKSIFLNLRTWWWWWRWWWLWWWWLLWWWWWSFVFCPIFLGHISIILDFLTWVEEGEQLGHLQYKFRS